MSALSRERRRRRRHHRHHRSARVVLRRALQRRAHEDLVVGIAALLRWGVLC